MRIIAGRFKGTALASVGKGDAAAHLRPTTDRVRENLFNLLMKYDAIDGARVLDMFAGTGALGLEALSRGAQFAGFLENGRKAQKLIAQNIAITRCQDQSQLFAQDATRLGACPTDPYDLVFMDPPYGKGMGQLALLAAARGGWLAPGALIVWEETAAQPAPDGFDLLDTRGYGSTVITILEYQPEKPPSGG